MLATRGGSRTPGLYHDSDRSVGSADQPSLLNPRFEPAMATRGGRRPRFEPSVATRGRRRPQYANSAQSIRQYNYVVDVDGGGYANSHWAGCGYLYLPTRRKKECTPPPTTPTTSRDPNRFGATVWGNGLGQRFGATVRHNLSARPSGVWLRAVFELRREEGAGRSTLTLRNR